MPFKSSRLRKEAYIARVFIALRSRVAFQALCISEQTQLPPLLPTCTPNLGN